LGALPAAPNEKNVGFRPQWVWTRWQRKYTASVAKYAPNWQTKIVFFYFLSLFHASFQISVWMQRYTEKRITLW